jgi:hypothetical protein
MGDLCGYLVDFFALLLDHLRLHLTLVRVDFPQGVMLGSGEFLPGGDAAHPWYDLPPEALVALRHRAASPSATPAIRG